ncbi:MAG: J domain-containing protein [Polaromonas sp.]
MTTSKTVSIARPQGARTLSAGQRKFNGLIQKIEVQRKLLAAWNEGIPLYQQRHANEFEPLLETWRGLNSELAHFLDQRADQKGFSKTERQTLRELICDLAAQLMHGKDHDEMKALFNKHSATDFDTEEKQAQDALKAMVEDTFGLELGDDVDVNSPEAVLQRLQEEMQARQADEPQRAQRKPTARQIRQQAEANHTSQSIREVYRKLASALHPDREPDPRERERKTALMQRVNQAYDGKDLLGMLQLQLEIEQIDQSAIDTLAEDRLKHYNKVLAEQLAELQNEVRGVEHAFKMQFGLDPYERVSPSNLMQVLRKQVQLLQYDIHQLTRQRQSLSDINSIKRWLKEQQAEDVDVLLADLSALFR